MNVHFKGIFFLTQRLLPLIRDGGVVRGNPEMNKHVASVIAMGRAS